MNHNEHDNLKLNPLIKFIILMTISILFFIIGYLSRNYMIHHDRENLAFLYQIIGSKELSEGKVESAKIQFLRSIETNIHQCAGYLFLSDIYSNSNKDIELEMLKAARKGCSDKNELQMINDKISKLLLDGAKGEPNLFIWPDELK